MKHRNGPSPQVALAFLVLGALALVLMLARLPVESGPPSAPPPRVLLIGLDGADWVRLDRWFMDGELPHLSRLARSGLRGDLRTLRPIISPLVWTSIATGQPPDHHGVTDFFAATDRKDGLQPVSRLAIRTPTLWERLSARGLRVDLVAWWASWPADPKHVGRVVTDRIQFAFPGAGSGDALPDRTLYHPPELARQLQPCRLPPDRLDDRATGDFAPGADETSPLLRRVLAATHTYYRMGRELLRDGQANLTAVYFLGTDTVAHLYGAAADDDPRSLAPLYYYRLVDAMVGDLCAQAEPGTLVAVVSDHGFYSGPDRPSTDPSDFHRQAAEWHRPLGLVIFQAPWVTPGRLADASVLDIAPTLLWQLLGERIDDLPGRVLLQERPPGAGGPVAAGTVPPTRHDALAQTPRSTGDPAERYREQLRALGYLEDDEQGGSADARPMIHLADYLQWADRPAEALARLEAATEHLGHEPALLYRLAVQHSRAGQAGPALQALETALRLGLDPTPHRLATMTGICCAAGRTDLAESLLERSGGQDTSAARTARGLLAEQQGRHGDAMASYLAALEADPAASHAAGRIGHLMGHADPRLGTLCRTATRAAQLRTGDTGVQLAAGRLLLAANDPEAAKIPLGRAVHLEPDLVEPRLLLGRALYAAGRPAEAYERLSRGLAWHPRHPDLLAAAGAAAVQAGYPAVGAEHLEEAAAAGAAGPHLDAALKLAHDRSIH